MAEKKQFVKELLRFKLLINTILLVCCYPFLIPGNNSNENFAWHVFLKLIKMAG